MQSQALPSHRQLFTALINSLPQLTPATRNTSAESGATTGILEGSRHPDRRYLLLTLHVIFPSLLLPALDLLDRGLVTRLTVPLSSRAAASAGTQIAVVASDYGVASRSSDNGEMRTTNRESPSLSTGHAIGATLSNQPIQVYIVQSLASTLSRRRRDASQVSKRYIIHLNAWNCSCANFALDAYPSDAGITPDEKDEGLSRPLPFGGLSLDGKPSVGESVPCCKHLLACLLAERWEAVLGSHIENRHITKEELAALIASL